MFRGPRDHLSIKDSCYQPRSKRYSGVERVVVLFWFSLVVLSPLKYLYHSRCVKYWTTNLTSRNVCQLWSIRSRTTCPIARPWICSVRKQSRSNEASKILYYWRTIEFCKTYLRQKIGTYRRRHTSTVYRLTLNRSWGKWWRLGCSR